MKKTIYTVKYTTQFKKDYKLAMKRGLGIRLLDNIISALAMGLPLPEKSKDHALSGNWNGYTQRPFRQIAFSADRYFPIQKFTGTGLCLPKAKPPRRKLISPGTAVLTITKGSSHAPCKFPSSLPARGLPAPLPHGRGQGAACKALTARCPRRSYKAAPR